MLHVQSSPTVNETELGKAFIAAVINAETGAAKPTAASTSAVDALLSGQPDHAQPKSKLPIKPSQAACAVALAAAIARVPGLLLELRSGSPVIVFEAGTWAETAIERVLEAAFFGDLTAYPEPDSRAPLMIVRDGSSKDHLPEKGNEGVIDAISSGWPVIAISRDPKRLLPAAVHDAADRIVAVPGLDASRLILALETLFGSPVAAVDDELAAAVTPADLDICARPGLSVEAFLSRLLEQVRRRATVDGPTLQVLPGYGHAKTWGIELIEDFAAYRSGSLAWSELDHKSVLISGPPGVGKTQLARSIARTAGVPIIETSASQWNSATYLSGTLQMIRSVFAEARRRAPSVLFLDEADGVSNRESVHGEYREYWVQIVNKVLTELTSEANEGVIILAASNFPERIDPAIRRAGRLDFELRLELPDISGMSEILRYHLGEELPGADLEMLATIASGGSGADAFAWVTRARAAARRQKRGLRVEDLVTAIQLGRQPLTPALRRRVAVHEAGHVVASWALNCGTLRAVAIYEGGGAAHFGPEQTLAVTQPELENRIAVLLAGRAAEKLLLDGPSAAAGAGNDSDLELATAIAIDIETRLGLGKRGPMHSPAVASDLNRNPLLFAAVLKPLVEAELKAEALLQANIDGLRVLADALEIQGHLSGSAAISLLANIGSRKVS